MIRVGAAIPYSRDNASPVSAALRPHSATSDRLICRNAISETTTPIIGTDQSSGWKIAAIDAKPTNSAANDQPLTGRYSVKPGSGCSAVITYSIRCIEYR